jgi:hypothetical protein
MPPKRLVLIFMLVYLQKEDLCASFFQKLKITVQNDEFNCWFFCILFFQKLEKRHKNDWF